MTVGAAVDIAVIHGRFQPLHIGHMEYLLAGKERCELLIIGITNPDPSQIKVEPTNPTRSAGLANRRESQRLRFPPKRGRAWQFNKAEQANVLESSGPRIP